MQVHEILRPALILLLVAGGFIALVYGALKLKRPVFWMLVIVAWILWGLGAFGPWLRQIEGVLMLITGIGLVRAVWVLGARLTTKKNM